MQNIKYKNLILSIFISFSLFGYAQDENQSPAAIEKMKLNWIWNKTTNAAGLKLDNSRTYTSLDGGYEMTSGNFHRVMNGEKNNSLILNTEGGVNVNNFYFWGKFNYSRDAIKDAKFNSSIIDPYRGMPYFVADENSSDWNNQHYDLQFKVNFPEINEKLALGLNGEYYASIGAKQRDIRTENYYMQLILRPGLIYSINNQNHIGFNLEYYSLREESQMHNVNTYIDQTYYVLHGLGTATIGVGSGRSTNYVGNNFGGGIQYNYSGLINLMLSSNYSVKVEDAEITFTNPRPDGSVTEKVWHSKAMLSSTTERNNSHYLELEYMQKNRDGIEYITKYDDTEDFDGYLTLFKSIRSTYANKNIKVGYTWTKNKNNEYKWLVGGKFNYSKFDDEYILPESVRNGENISGEIIGKRNFTLSDKLSKNLIIGASFLYNKNLNGEYTYGGAFKDYPIHSELIMVDNNYHNSDYYTGTLSGVYSQRIKEENPINLFVKANLLYTKTNSYNFNDRKTVLVSIGCTF